VCLQCEDQGIRFEPACVDGDEEDWEDVQEEMEDFWMRSPKVLANISLMHPQFNSVQLL